MKIIIGLFITSILFILLLNCASSFSNEQKASEILKEIREINAKSVRKELPIESFTNKLQKIEKSRETFPTSREAIKQDVNDVIAFLKTQIDTNEKIAAKYEELLKLNLNQNEAECLQVNYKLIKKYSEQSDLSISQYKLFLDNEITSKETLNTKNLEFKEKADRTNAEIIEIKKQENLLCVNKQQ